MKSQTRLNSYASILVLLAGFLVGAGGGTADPCLTPDFHELPVVTHWSNSTQAFKYLASDQISSAYLRPAYVPGASYQNGRAYYYYNAKLLPNFEKYIGANFSTVQVPKAEAIKFCQHVFQRTGISLKLLRPDAFDRPEAGLGRLRSLLGTVQVLHGKVIDGSLATIILPPHWDAKAPAGSYPIVFSGLYDLNENVFKAFGEGRSLAEITALSGTKGNRGAIAVLWNGGDALAGYSVNPSAYRQFASVIDYVASNFSGDRQRILMTGTSRGALISFVMASNPYRGTNAIYDYTVKFVAATAVPAKIGDNFGTMPSATYPWLWKAAFVITGLADTLQPGWTYPAGGHPNLQGFTPAQASLFITTGQSDPDVVNTNLSPISAHFIQGLRESGTQVFLELTAFDIAVPFANQIEYVTKLHEAGIPVQAEVLLRAGHVISRELGLTDNVEGLKNARRQALLKAVLSYVSPTGPVAPKVTPGFSFYRVSRSSTPPSLEPFVPADKLFPFTFEAPRLAKRGESFPLVAVGEP
ncbi:MAG: hypothetical protein QOK44_5472, partial [Betaproteobacteria bacterium]|nr:hypothetical protein [Betaproteobacteria bacterium]